MDQSEMVLGTPGGKIPVIEEPAVADDWSGLDQGFPDMDLVVGVERGGEALSGPHEGQSLPRANFAPAMLWFAWLDFNPETTVYGVDA